MSEPKFIRANKCVIGGVYYLTGMWYEYNFYTIDKPPFVSSKNNIPLINTPVVFVGIVKGYRRYRFEFTDGSNRAVQSYADEDFLLEPIEEPEILRN